MKKVKRVLMMLILTLALGFAFGNNLNKSLKVQASTVKDEREFKAVWMSTFTGEAPYSSESQFKSLMNGAFDAFEYYGINAVIFHVRTHNNAFYESDLNPRASWWRTANFDVFDPIGWLIEESHKRGIEFHAWMNPYRVSTGYQTGTVPTKNPQTNPDNLIVEGSSVILNPALRRVKEHIYNTIEEFITLYPTVDAVHFDDYFYINTNAEPNNDDARRAHVDEMIKGVKDTLDDFNEQNGTAIQFGISPTGIWKNGNGVVTYDENGNPITTGSATSGFAHYGSYLYADTVKWATEGWIDYLLPQTYWARDLSAAKYEPLVNWWDKVFKNLHVNIYSGIGVYMADDTGSRAGWHSDAHEMDAQLTILENLDTIDGYSIYSYKHLERGYKNTSNFSATQIKNAYNTDYRRAIKVLPEIKNMTPVIPGKVSNITHEKGKLNWNTANDAKFYYIYRSTGEVTFSSEQIIGVVGNNETTFMTNDLDNDYNYGIKALSRTNHLGEGQIIELQDKYLINYVLNGGDFISEYTLRDDMIEDFLTDFYEFLNPSVSLNTFIHGAGNSKNYDGLYNEEEYFNYLFEKDNKTVDVNSNKFINQPEYNKWLPLMDLMDEYVTAVNSTQSFWGSPFTARSRIKAFFQKNNYGIAEATPLLSVIPDGLLKTLKVANTYTKSMEVNLIAPTKKDDKFLGWYEKANFEGQAINKIEKGTTGDKTYYARWETNAPLKDVTINFNLNYDNLTLESLLLKEGDQIVKPVNPTRNGYTFIGWFVDGEEFDFSLKVIKNITLTAFWELTNYNISYQLAGGVNNVNNPTKYTINDSIVLEEPTKNGYIFTGWYLNGVKENSIIKGSTGSKSFVASWEKVKYEVTFDINNGEGDNPTAILVAFDEVYGVLPEVTKVGYTFIGWYLGDVKITSDAVVKTAENHELTAQWEINQYTITFLSDGGSEVEKITGDYGSLITIPDSPIKEGYIFTGWDILIPQTMPAENLTLTAQWQIIASTTIVKSINSASIRTKGTEGLRFYAELEENYINNEHGFYLIYGLTTKEELLNKINNSNGEFYINDKIVYKKEVTGINNNNQFQIVLTGITVKGYLDKISVIPYVVVDGEIVLANDFVVKSLAEVAITAYKETGEYQDIIDVIDNNIFKIRKTSDSLFITKSSVSNISVSELESCVMLNNIFLLPELTLNYKYFDGNKYYNPNEYFTVKEEIELRIVYQK